MNVKIDYASINDEDEPLKLRKKRDSMNDEDDDDTSDADSDSESRDEDDDNDDHDLEDDEHQPTGNDTDTEISDDDESNDNDNDNDKAGFENEYGDVEVSNDVTINASDDSSNGSRDDDNNDNDDDDDDDDNDDNNDDDLSEINGDDDDDNAEESRYRKINQDFRRNYITETHPETNTHTEDEIHALAKVVRNKLGIIVDPLHRTVPILTKYEKTRILGIRTKQLNNGAEPFISSKLNISSEKIIDGYPIALKELEEKKLPFIIRRPLPGGGVEYWYLQDLEVL